jgi:hypothetical protein
MGIQSKYTVYNMRYTSQEYTAYTVYRILYDSIPCIVYRIPYTVYYYRIPYKMGIRCKIEGIRDFVYPTLVVGFHWNQWE